MPPFCLVGRSEANSLCNSCYIDFEEGARRLVKHLMGLNRRKMALLCSVNEPNLEEQIIHGFKRATLESRVTLDFVSHIKVENSVKGGYDAADLIIEGGADTVFASSDDLAIGLIEALREKSVLVPEKIAVTGFSDSPLSSVVTPKLTTVEQPANKLGIVAARMLFDLIDGDGIGSPPQEIVLLPKLKIRNSCGNFKPINTLFE